MEPNDVSKAKVMGVNSLLSVTLLTERSDEVCRSGQEDRITSHMMRGARRLLPVENSSGKHGCVVVGLVPEPET